MNDNDNWQRITIYYQMFVNLIFARWFLLYAKFSIIVDIRLYYLRIAPRRKFATFFVFFSIDLL